VSLPVVVVAGRPNVGKSSLVNRIVGRRAAVVEEQPGVTRDRKALDAEWTGVPFTIVDTGGWLAGGTALDTKVSAQAEKAVAEADVVLLVVDVTVGVTEEDLAAARVVRRTGVPVRLVVNKVDDVGREGPAWEFVSLGVGDPWPVSAIHGRGTGDLLDEVVAVLGGAGDATAGAGNGADQAVHGPTVAGNGATGTETVVGMIVDHAPELGELVSEDGRPPRVALVGRPNVGKSTLFNRLIGEERAVVHDMPGTTRDTIDTVVVTPEGPLCFVDTAGMRRPSKTERGPESYSVLRALDALEEADIALLVIDATVGATHQDQRLAERIGASGCPAVVVLNKWDLVATGDREDVMAGVGERLAFLGIAPVLRVSATSGRGAHKILPALIAAVDAYHQRVSTGALNRALRDIQASHPAPGARIRYGVQGAIDPPTFTLFATGRLPQTYLRYVERGLREHFDLGPTPIKLRVRAGGGR
jgi:GTPase